MNVYEQVEKNIDELVDNNVSKEDKKAILKRL